MLPNLPPLACPGCQSPIPSLQCRACGTTYPLLEDLPVLLAQPEHALADWRNRWRLERQRLQRESTRAARAAARSTGPTKVRLETVAAGMTGQREAVEKILAPMLANDQGGARETLLALRTRLPSHHGPTSYNTHIARDWVWGEAENAATLARIEPLLGDATGLVLVPGSGAGRLAWDLSQRYDIIALESNPLLALLTRDLAQGREHTITEFPLAPIGAADVAVRHRVRAPAATSRLKVVLADLLNPPFAAGSFDVVVTHWLIDVIDCPFSQLVSTINHLLRPGGVWINAGSVGFTSGDLADNPTVSEVMALVAAGGFNVDIEDETDIGYLCSPHSRQRRSERILTFRATRTRGGAWSPWNYLPAWLTGNAEPVPLLPAFATQAVSVRIHAWLMGMIDGHRSAADIAAELARQGLMPRNEAEAAVRNFLRVMWEEMQRSG